jgi:hypothetical protein
MTDLIGVWEFDEEDDLAGVTARALDGQVEPSWKAALIASRGDVVTLQLESGAKPSSAATTRYYVEKRGPYRRLRSETWPSEAGPKTLITLRAWPQRGID